MWQFDKKTRLKKTNPAKINPEEVEHAHLRAFSIEILRKIQFKHYFFMLLTASGHLGQDVYNADYEIFVWVNLSDNS